MDLQESMPFIDVPHADFAYTQHTHVPAQQAALLGNSLAYTLS